MIFETILRDPTEKAFPPERVLRLTTVDDLAFVSIEEYEEDAKERRYTVIEEMTVSLPALRELITAHTHDRDREDMRPEDKHGVSPRIGGYRIVSAPL